MILRVAGITNQILPFDDGSILFMVEPHFNDVGPTRIRMFTQGHTYCTVYAVALAAGATTPTQAQIKAGQDASGNPAIASAFAVDEMKGGTFYTLSGLTENTTYKICTYLDEAPAQSVVHTIDVVTLGGASISAALKTLTGACMDFSGDSVTLTGTDVDSVLNSFENPYGNTSPRTGVTLKPVYAASTGPNSTPVIKFDGTNKVIVSGTPSVPAVVDFQSLTVHFLFKAINTTTSQCLLTNMVNPSTGAQGSKGFRVLIGNTSNQMSFQFWNMNNTQFVNVNEPFTDVTNFHLITIRVKSIDDSTSIVQCYLDGVIKVNLTSTNRMGATIDTPITFGGFTFPSNIFPGRFDLSRCTIYQWYHTNEKINFAWSKYNTKYGLSIPMLP